MISNQIEFDLYTLKAELNTLNLFFLGFKVKTLVSIKIIVHVKYMKNKYPLKLNN